MAERSILPAGDEDELQRALADLGHQLAYPPTPNLTLRIRQRLAAQPRRRLSFWRSSLTLRLRLSLAVLALVVLAGTVLAVSPAVRGVVADRLGLRGVQIIQQPAPPSAAPAGVSPASLGVGTRLNLGQPITLEQARARVVFPVEVPAALGAPEEVYLLDIPVSGQVALVYLPRPDLPQANTTGVGLLLTEFQGNVHSTGVFGKGLPAGTRLEEVQVASGRGYWVEGDPHVFFFLDARGQVQSETTRLAGNTLLWEHGDLTLRLESGLPKDRALNIAASAQ